MKLYRIFSIITVLALMFSFVSTPDVLAATSTQAAPSVGGSGESRVGPNNEVTCLGCPLLKIVKAADASDVTVNGLIGFTITVTNVGPNLARDIVMTDTLPAGTNWSEDSEFCSITGTALTCNYATIPINESVSVHVTGTSTAQMCGTISNTASVTGYNRSVSKSNTVKVNILCPADVVVTKTAEKSPVSPGETIRFTITVKNQGSADAQEVLLADPLPTGAGLTWKVDSVTGGGGCQIGAGILSCDFQTLTPDAVRTVVISSPTTAAGCGDINNTASVQSSTEPDEVKGNNSASAKITVTCPVTSITVTKEADDSSVNMGEPIGFRITVTNTGAVDLPVVNLEDQLNNQVTWTDDSASCAISTSGMLTCTFNNLAAGASASVHITATSSGAICGDLVNVAYAWVEGQPRTASQEAVITVNCPVDVTVTKKAEKIVLVHAAGQASGPARFIIQVRNQGSGTAQDVTLTDPLPDAPGLTWTIDSVVGGGACSVETLGGLTLSCTFGDLPAGAVRTVTISSPIDNTQCDPATLQLSLDNTVTVAAANEPSDKQENNTAYAQIRIICSSVCVNLPYRENFEVGQPDQSKWIRPNGEPAPVTVAPKGQRFLGELANESISLTLNFCPGTAGQKIMLAFDFYAIRSWDGNALLDGVQGPGPDTWELSIENGPTLIHSTFSNWGFYKQTYPARSDSGIEYKPRTDAVAREVLGYRYDTVNQDTVYHMIVSFPLTQDSVTILFTGIGLQGTSDESWGIDNIEMIPLGNTPDHHIPMLMK